LLLPWVLLLAAVLLLVFFFCRPMAHGNSAAVGFLLL
jgi:hypothetical protein